MEPAPLLNPQAVGTALLPALEAWIARAIMEAPEELRLLLYRVDIPEARAREAAATPNGPRALALLMIEREVEKAKSRAQHKPPPAILDADLAW